MMVLISLIDNYKSNGEGPLGQAKVPAREHPGQGLRRLRIHGLLRKLQGQRGHRLLDASGIKRRTFSSIQLVQTFISTNSKTLQLSPFDYSVASKPVQGQNLENFDWDNAFSNSVKEEPAVNLNLIDLDFLETMGMNPSPPKVVKQQSLPQKPAQNKIISDPNAILAKLNDKNN